ncbi:MAG: carbon-nitrogen hydrolase family protein [Candidatus Odinarchaeota archaeon]
MTARKMTIALGQIQSIQGNVETNLEMIRNTCDAAVKKNADLVVFPELGVTGYLIYDDVVRLACPIPESVVIRDLEKIAAEYGIFIVTGLPEEAIQGIYYNVAVVIGPSGYIDKYRKILLPQHSVFDEKRYFRPGTSIHSVDTPLGKLGLCICYDLFSPEIARYHALNGCSLLVCISASPGIRQKYFETFTQSRAMENSIFVAYVNQAGIQDNLIFWGGSEVISPSGKRILKLAYDEPAFGVATLDLQRVKTNRAFVPTIRDNPEWIYKDLESVNRGL